MHVNCAKPGIDWVNEANALRDRLVAWRRDFHIYPEIGFQEWRTAGIVAVELERLGYKVQTGVAETGVVGLAPAHRPGPVVLLRFDMDCLPLQEENDVPYRSQSDGLMHACGHDGHVAIGLGVATLLARRREQCSGTVKLMFQPKEEGRKGAARMIDAGILEHPRPHVALAAHIWNDTPLGQVGLATGPVMAAADVWECRIQGVGGHGAAPHQTADPVVAAAQVILAWQNVVSRNVDPQEAAVLSVCSIQAGEAFNIIPDAVTLKGTIRTFDRGVRETVLSRFEKIAKVVSVALGCKAEIEIQDSGPALVNDPGVTAVVRRVAARIVGEENIVDICTMGSEDMALVNAQVPGCYIFVGSRNEAAGLIHPHHSPRFDFDEDVLPLTVALLTAAAVAYLQPLKGSSTDASQM